MKIFVPKIQYFTLPAAPECFTFHQKIYFPLNRKKKSSGSVVHVLPKQLTKPERHVFGQSIPFSRVSATAPSGAARPGRTEPPQTVHKTRAPLIHRHINENRDSAELFFLSLLSSLFFRYVTHRARTAIDSKGAMNIYHCSGFRHASYSRVGVNEPDQMLIIKTL